MPRAGRSHDSRHRRKKVLKAAKGYFGGRRKLYTVAKHAVEKGLQYAYRDRRNRKREFRRLWIVRINAAARLHDLTYSRFVNGLKDEFQIEIQKEPTTTVSLATLPRRPTVRVLPGY